MNVLQKWKNWRNKLCDDLEKQDGQKIASEERAKIDRRLSEILSYQPRIGLFGKTGAGKSSLCNALSGENACKIDDNVSCTRNTQELFVQSDDGKSLKLIDVPGVGENQKRDDEYSKLYQELLPELDVVLWILKADERAYGADAIFYEKIVKPHIDQGKPLFFILNQVDKIEPFREWDEKKSEPSPKQKENIKLKSSYLVQIFDIKPYQVIGVSAKENYGLIDLVDNIVSELPKEKRITFVERVNQNIVSSQARQKAQTSLLEVVQDTFEEACGWIGENIIDPVSDLWDSVSSGCFITTAVCERQAKPDDCYELTQFRRFRDEWLLLQDDGESIVRYYYQTAPRLLEAINQRDDSEEILASINSDYLLPCLKLIEEQRYVECKELYISMVEGLENKLDTKKGRIANV